MALSVLFRFLVFFIISATAFSVDAKKKFGLGVIIGDPTGLSGKYWINKTRAIDGALSWSFGDNSSFRIHSTYLFHKFAIFKIEKHPIDLYYGLGGRIKNKKKKDEDEVALGPRAPIGLRYIFKDPTIEVFLELSLALDLIPSTAVDLDFGVGGRYYF